MLPLLLLQCLNYTPTQRNINYFLFLLGLCVWRRSNSIKWKPQKSKLRNNLWTRIVDVQFIVDTIVFLFFVFHFLLGPMENSNGKGFFFDCGGRDGKVTGTHNGRDKQTREYINQNNTLRETMRHTQTNEFEWKWTTCTHTLAVWVRSDDSVANPLPQMAHWNGRFLARSNWASWLRRCCCKFDNWIMARPHSGTWQR